MAKFLFWSDLHLEFDDEKDATPFVIPLPAGEPGAEPDAPFRDEIDAILIAGDTMPKGGHVTFMKKVWDIWQKPVLAVAGNHEPYGMRFDKHLRKEREALELARAEGADIEVMRAATRVIGDTRIIASTLWTDQMLYPDRKDWAHVTLAEQMNDYRRVQWHDAHRGTYRKMLPVDTKRMHAEELAYILGELEKPFEGRTVVMTHHLPIKEMLHQRHIDANQTVICAYASDLWHVIGAYNIDAWICGHSHDSNELRMEGAYGDVSFLRNIRAYPNEETDFNPVRLLDSQNPRLAAELVSEQRNSCEPSRF